MPLSDEELASFAEAMRRIEALLGQVTDALRVGDGQTAEAFVATARAINQAQHQRMIALGVVDPLEDPFLQIGVRPEDEDAAALTANNVPLHLLATPAAERYAEAIRSAANACREVEQERNTGPRVAQVLSEFADMAETECFGPKFMREME